MQRSKGALALDFGDSGGRASVLAAGGLRLARRSGVVRGPGKYQVLEHRRRQAQIRARRVLDLLDLAESGTDGR
jgi:hypothetical protein